MRIRRSLIGLVTSAAVFVAAPAFGNSAGLGGYSGKPNVAAPQGASCGQCHAGGAAPQVVLNGPASLAAGASAEYTLVVSTTLSEAATGIAATDGVALAPVTGLRDSFGEMLSMAPVAVAGGQASFRFRVTAPTNLTSLRIWAVGVGADGTGNIGGDGAAQTSREIAITGAAPGSGPPPDPANPAAPGGNGSAAPGGNGTTTPGGGGPADDTVEDTSSGPRGERSRIATDDGWGCSASPSAARGGLGILMALAVGLVAAGRRRRA